MVEHLVNLMATLKRDHPHSQIKSIGEFGKNFQNGALVLLPFEAMLSFLNCCNRTA